MAKFIYLGLHNYLLGSGLSTKDRCHKTCRLRCFVVPWSLEFFFVYVVFCLLPLLLLAFVVILLVIFTAGLIGFFTYLEILSSAFSFLCWPCCCKHLWSHILPTYAVGFFYSPLLILELPFCSFLLPCVIDHRFGFSHHF